MCIDTTCLPFCSCIPPRASDFLHGRSQTRTHPVSHFNAFHDLVALVAFQNDTSDQFFSNIDVLPFQMCHLIFWCFSPSALVTLSFSRSFLLGPCRFTERNLTLGYFILKCFCSNITVTLPPPTRLLPFPSSATSPPYPCFKTLWINSSLQGFKHWPFPPSYLSISLCKAHCLASAVPCGFNQRTIFKSGDGERADILHFWHVFIALVEDISK